MKEDKPVTFLSGRYFTAAEIEQIRETVRDFSPLPWYELVQTICEHLEWVTPTGRNKIDSCAKALAKLLRRLAKIRDPRNPKTLQHKSTVLMLCGILAFAFLVGQRHRIQVRRS